MDNNKGNKMKIYQIHKTVLNLALKVRISIRRESNGHYYLVGNEKLSPRFYMSMQPTATSGVRLIKSYLKFIKNN